MLDDAHDKGEETRRLTSRNASIAPNADGESRVTTVNSDRLQRAWLARFGRTVAEHVARRRARGADGKWPVGHPWNR